MKAIKRNWIFIIMTLSLAFSACTLKNNEELPVENDSDIIEDDEQNSYIANPWTEVTKEEVINKDSEDLTEEENLFDGETIEIYLAKKYTCDTPPFYTVLDHITEDGLYVYHIFEIVDNGDESHTATIDWVTVNLKTGEATTFDEETFFIGEADIEEMKNEIADYKNFNYAEVDTKGLSEETLNMFAPCAIYFTDGADTANEDLLSSRDYRDICNFLFDFINYNGSELVHDFDFDPNIPTRKNRMKYEDWEYLLREVLKENNPEAVRNKLPDKFEGEVAVYYNSDDNCIYTERGTLGWEESASVREVKREGDAYIITYDLYWGGYSLWGVSEVTIAEADNKYGCSLVSVDYIKSIHDTDF